MRAKDSPQTCVIRDLACSRICLPADLPRWQSVCVRCRSTGLTPRPTGPTPAWAVPFLRHFGLLRVSPIKRRPDRLLLGTQHASYTPPLPFGRELPLRPIETNARFDGWLEPNVSPCSRCFTIFHNCSQLLTTW